MRVVVVGAGLSGLTAARTLVDDPALDVEVLAIDKGRSVGGRLATRRIGAARLDHGAQFFTVRGGPLRARTDDWLERGLVHEWCRGFPDRVDGYPRYVGSAGMNSLAKDLATGIECRSGELVFALRPNEDGWQVMIDDGTSVDADAVVVTCPVPQSWALLAASEIAVPEQLWRREYHRTVALLVTLDAPSAIPEPGGVQFDAADPDAPFGFIADNMVKGVSAVPAVTFHATQPWSADHWDDPASTLRELLLARGAPWLGDAGVLDAQVKKWRFAGPIEPWPEPCWVDDERGLVLAGDLFAGPKFEGAYESGLAAAAAVRAIAQADVAGEVDDGAASGSGGGA